jgi:hypothetical protein
MERWCTSLSGKRTGISSTRSQTGEHKRLSGDFIILIFFVKGVDNKVDSWNKFLEKRMTGIHQIKIKIGLILKFNQFIHFEKRSIIQSG